MANMIRKRSKPRETRLLSDGRIASRADGVTGGTGALYIQRVDYEQKSRTGRKGMASRWGLPDPEKFDGTGEQLAEFAAASCRRVGVKP